MKTMKSCTKMITSLNNLYIVSYYGMLEHIVIYYGNFPFVGHNENTGINVSKLFENMSSKI